MYKYFFGLLMLCLPALLTAQDVHLYFNSNSSGIREADAVKLRSVAGDYKASPFQIVLSGYADSIGSVSSNLELSRQRVGKIKDFLVSQGVPAKDIAIQYFGEVPGSSDPLFQQRRVRLQTIARTTGDRTVAGIIKSFAPKTQVLYADASKDIRFEANKGTIVYIPSGSLITNTGKKVSGQVKIEISEFYSMSEYIAGGLTTIADGNLINSGGMINLRLFSGKDMLQLKDSARIELSFPRKTDGTFYTFYADTSGGQVNWKLDETLWREAQLPKELGAYMSSDLQLVVTDARVAADSAARNVYETKTGKFRKYSAADSAEAREQMAARMRTDSMVQRLYNVLGSRSLDYINCDQFMRWGNPADVEYYIRITQPGMRIVRALILFKKRDALLSLREAGDRLGFVARLPLREPASIFIIAMKGDKIYHLEKPVELENRKTDDIVLEEITDTQLTKVMRSL